MNPGAPTQSDLTILASDLQALLDRPINPDGTRQNDDARTPYRIRDGIWVETLNAQGRPVSLQVAPRDISCSGLGALHRGHIPAGTAVIVHLPSSAGDTLYVRGSVTRSFGLAQDVYDIGISFAEPVDTNPLLARAHEQAHQVH